MPNITDDKLVLEKFAALPEQLKKQALDFMDFLLKEKAQKSAIKQKKAVFGSYKGTFKMSDDFNEPLDDFKDYMQ